MSAKFDSVILPLNLKRYYPKQVEHAERKTLKFLFLVVGDVSMHCWKIAQSPLLDKLYCAPGNGGLSP